MSSPIKPSIYPSSPGSSYAAGTNTPSSLPEGSYFTPPRYTQESSYITPPARLPQPPSTSSTPERRLTHSPTASSRSRRIPLVPLSPEDYEEMLRRKELYLSLSFNEVVGSQETRSYFTPSQRWSLPAILASEGGCGSDSNASDGSGVTPTQRPVSQRWTSATGESVPCDVGDGVTPTQRRGSRAWFNSSQTVKAPVEELAGGVRGKRKRSTRTAEDGSSPCEKGVGRRRFRRWDTY